MSITIRVLEQVKKAGKPVSCGAIAREIDENAFDVRYALHCLISKGEVLEVRGLYERAHGGYGPGPGDAA